MSAIVAKMLVSVWLLIATIACSKSPAPIARSACSSLASTSTAWVTSGAMLVDERHVVVDREDLVAQRHQLEGGGAPEPTEADDEDRVLHAPILLRRQPMRIVSIAGR